MCHRLLWIFKWNNYVLSRSPLVVIFFCYFHNGPRTANNKIAPKHLDAYYNFGQFDVSDRNICKEASFLRSVSALKFVASRLFGPSAVDRIVHQHEAQIQSFLGSSSETAFRRRLGNADKENHGYSPGTAVTAFLVLGNHRY